MKPMEVELGARASRSLVMENTGRTSPRIWWIVSAAVLAMCTPTAGSVLS